jgi:hypothetical protein
LNAAAEILLKQLKHLQIRYDDTQKLMDDLSIRIDELIKEKNTIIAGIDEIESAVALLSNFTKETTVKKKGSKK